LLVGLGAYLAASAACALAPSVGVLVLLRLVQGLAGAAGLVIARAVARDLYSGRVLVVFFSRLTLVSGLAPVVAPVLGGQLSRVMDWRGIFLVLAGLGAVLLLAGLAQPESLPPSRRSSGGLSSTWAAFGMLLRDRFFLGTALACGLAAASMFAYIAGATFVLQQIYGLSALSELGARLGRHWSTVSVLALGLALNLLGAAALAATVLLGLGLPFLLGSLFVMVSALGLVFPTATALAMSGYPQQAGTASSLLGLGQFMFGAVVAPLVGVAGEETAVPLGLVALGASACASLLFLTVVLPVVRQGRAGPGDGVLAGRPPPG
jgi:DHA1 family bicyclomycin/chloramphenicol resistance-like MFS transporter